MSYKVDKKNKVSNYLNLLNESLKHELDLVVGPEYSLSEKMDLMLEVEAKKIRKDLRNLSKRYPSTTIIPGSMFLKEGTDNLVSRSFVYQNEKEMFFDKQTGVEEISVAERNGLHYKKESGRANTFNIGNKKAWLQICSDRSRKPENICFDSDLEIIISHDRNTGISGGSYPENDRYIMLSDSYYPEINLMQSTRGIRSSSISSVRLPSKKEKEIIFDRSGFIDNKLGIWYLE